MYTIQSEYFNNSSHTVAGAVSNCLPPWLETNTPSHPRSAAIFASAALKIPFTIIGRSVILNNKICISDSEQSNKCNDLYNVVCMCVCLHNT